MRRFQTAVFRYLYGFLDISSCVCVASSFTTSASNSVYITLNVDDYESQR